MDIKVSVLTGVSWVRTMSGSSFFCAWQMNSNLNSFASLGRLSLQLDISWTLCDIPRIFVLEFSNLFNKVI